MKNSKDAKSVLTLQKTLRDLATWKLAATEGKRLALETSQKQLLDSLNRTDGLGIALAPFVSKKLRDIDRDISSAKREYAHQSQEAIAHGARSKMAERAHQRAEQRDRARAERKNLMELLERQTSADKSSLE